jgi:hypothetical protein
MKTVTLGLAGVGRIGAMHAKNVGRLNHALNKDGIQVRLILTDMAEEHARSIAAHVGAESLRKDLRGHTGLKWPAFVEVILGMRENRCTPEDAVATSKIADAAQQSLDTGLTVQCRARPCNY